MAKFRFRFETVARVRKSREDEALRGLATAQRAHQAARERKDHLVKELADACLRREHLATQPVTIIAFRTEQDFITGTKQRIIQAEQAILRATRGVEKALRFYLHARKQTRTIETLRDKMFAEWRRQQAKREQKDLNDLNVMRARMVSPMSATVPAGTTQEVA